MLSIGVTLQRCKPTYARYVCVHPPANYQIDRGGRVLQVQSENTGNFPATYATTTAVS